MGSTVSTALGAGAAQRSALRTTGVKAGSVSATCSARDGKAARIEPPQAQPQQPPSFQSASGTEWAATLNKMSGAISSANWHAAQHAAAPRDSGDDDVHAARQSMVTAGKLPQQRSRTGDGGHDGRVRLRGVTGCKLRGRLSQVELLELFQLRRLCVQLWDAKVLSEKYGVEERDVEDLLKYTRTYTARLDSDGLLRGYYQADTDNTIQRFEKD